MEVEANPPSQRRCPHCGYDLRSQTHDDPAATVTCPECGNPAPPREEKVFAEPGPLWHVMMSVAFGLPLLLAGFEAADEMVIHRSWGVAFAPRGLALIVFSGGAVIFAGWTWAVGRTRHKDRIVLLGAAYFFGYCAILAYLSQWIAWSRYMV